MRHLQHLGIEPEVPTATSRDSRLTHRITLVGWYAHGDPTSCLAVPIVLPDWPTSGGRRSDQRKRGGGCGVLSRIVHVCAPGVTCLPVALCNAGAVVKGVRRSSAMRIGSFNVESCLTVGRRWIPRHGLRAARCSRRMRRSTRCSTRWFTHRRSRSGWSTLIQLGLEKEDQPRGGRPTAAEPWPPAEAHQGWQRDEVGDRRKRPEDWIGWIELTKEPTDGRDTHRTGDARREGGRAWRGRG